ncbi:hypothetical protein HN51_067190 [Arachis hypogaea]|nr:Beta-galactosidase [Arachis hypogaea]
MNSGPFSIFFCLKFLALLKLLMNGSKYQMWLDLINKAKEGGLDAIETYVFWNAHEPSRRLYDFSGNKDLIRFLKTIQEAGLYSILRIGPYVCAEWNYGGIPVWVHNLPGVEIRTANSVYMNEMHLQFARPWSK